MSELDSIRNLSIFIIIIGGLIFLHELGHFLAALKLGVKIKEFGLGFPPRLLGTARDKNGQRRWFSVRAPQDLDPNSIIYSLNFLPLGGFVRPAGEDDPTVPNGLAAAPKLTRLIVLAAGPGANLLIGILVFTLAFATGWPQTTDRLRIKGVVSDAPADVSGVQPGDIVLTANGETITAENNLLPEITHANLGQPVQLVLERSGRQLEITVIPRTEWPRNQGPMGVVLDREWTLVTQPLPQAFLSSLTQIGLQVRETFLLPFRMIEGQMQTKEVRFVSVVGLKDISDQVVKTAVEVQAVFPLLQFIGLITVALALTNLLPLPALDGGRILFVLIEAVRGRRIDPLREGYVHVMGMLVLLALMVVMVINDIIDPIIPR